MAKLKGSIMVIGYALTVFYGFGLISLLANPDSFGPLTDLQSPVMFVFFSALTACSLFVIFLKEWGRKLLIITSVIFAAFLFALFLGTKNLSLPSLIILNVVVVLYFSQQKVNPFFLRGFTGRRKSILLVDDDEGLLKTVKSILLNNGYSVLTATSGEKGIRIAKSQRPDLVILDVILPGVKGREVCGQLKEIDETKDIPVIFLTAKDSQDDIRAEIEAGGRSHLTKPVNAKALLAEIKKAFESE